MKGIEPVYAPTLKDAMRVCLSQRKESEATGDIAEFVDEQELRV